MIFAGRGALVFFSGVMALAGTASAFAETDASTVKLAPHRAIYDLKLTQSRGSQSMQGVDGRILYDFTGSSCEGYALQFRQVSELDAGEGKAALSDLRATTWEDGAATSFRFNSENTINEKKVESVDGQAERGGQGVAVNLTKPERKNFDIGPGMVFPTEHLRRIIAAARDGKTLLELPVFDGSENGEKVFNTLTILGRPIPPDQRVPTDAAAGKAELAGLTRWPVTISYYDKQGSSSGEQTPIYSISFELYDNGVSRALLLDYNDFVLRGEMSSLELKNAKPCN